VIRAEVDRVRRPVDVKYRISAGIVTDEYKGNLRQMRCLSGTVKLVTLGQP
jgi:hypothetical protein